jgi:hypothetical protein
MTTFNSKTIHVALLILTLNILFSCGPSEEEIEIEKKNKKHSELAEKYKCDNVEDCLSKYEFEGARAYYSYDGTDEFDIVTAESQYWLKEKEYMKSLSIIEAYSLEEDHYQKAKTKLRFNTISSIIDDYIIERNFEKAKEYALRLNDNINIENETKEYYSRYNDDEKNPFESQQDEMLKKIEKAEKLLVKSE